VTTWINGRRTRLLDCRDRGLQYGDGVFETLRVEAGAVRLLDWHLDRLLEGCTRLAIAAPARSLLHAELRRCAARGGEGVLKLIVTRGPGARGYRPSGRERCTRILSWHAEAPPAPAAARLRLCRTRLGSNAALAGLKTLNRLESVLARAEWRDPRVWEGLMQDADGYLVCGTMSNLFVRRARTLVTPRLDRAGVAGVMRRWVLQNASAVRLKPVERRLRLEDVIGAEEMFMTNALVGIRSVTSLRLGRQTVRYASSMAADRLRTQWAVL
jgi:4-amino-4-deoxychorismate lyase